MRWTIAIAAAIVVSMMAAPAFAGEEVPNPFPAKNVRIAMYVDTVTASPGESGTGVDYPKACTQMSLYRQGEGVVFRMWAFNARSGKVMTDKNTKFARVKIPGQPTLEMRFSGHGRTDPRPWFWTARWDIPLDYPLGTVDFKVVIKAKKGKKNKGTFKQVPVKVGAGLPSLGVLEIVESRPVETPLPAT